MQGFVYNVNISIILWIGKGNVMFFLSFFVGGYFYMFNSFVNRNISA